MVENSSEWRSLDSEIPSFKLQEKISRGRFEKLSKNCQNFWSAKLLSSQVFVVSLYNKDRDWHFWSTRFDFWAKSWICRISTHFWKRVILTVLSFVAGQWKVFLFDPHIQEEQPSHFFFVKIYFTRSLGVNSCLRMILYLFFPLCLQECANFGTTCLQWKRPWWDDKHVMEPCSATFITTVRTPPWW